jgi:hypothetical protein
MHILLWVRNSGRADQWVFCSKQHHWNYSGVFHWRPVSSRLFIKASLLCLCLSEDNWRLASDPQAFCLSPSNLWALHEAPSLQLSLQDTRQTLKILFSTRSCLLDRCSYHLSHSTSFSLDLKLVQHHFLHILFVNIVTAQSRLKEKENSPNLSVEGCQRNCNHF